MFRFTIRELVLLTLVVAMGVGWWVDRSRIAIQRDHAIAVNAHANEYVRLTGKYRRWRYGPEPYEYLMQLADPTARPDKR
jgi:hypothetical protein